MCSSSFSWPLDFRFFMMIFGRNGSNLPQVLSRRPLYFASKTEYKLRLPATSMPVDASAVSSCCTTRSLLSPIWRIRRANSYSVIFSARFGILNKLARNSKTIKAIPHDRNKPMPAPTTHFLAPGLVKKFFSPPTSWALIAGPN